MLKHKFNQNYEIINVLKVINETIKDFLITPLAKMDDFDVIKTLDRAVISQVATTHEVDNWRVAEALWDSSPIINKLCVTITAKRDFESAVNLVDEIVYSVADRSHEVHNTAFLAIMKLWNLLNGDGSLLKAREQHLLDLKADQVLNYTRTVLIEHLGSYIWYLNNHELKSVQKDVNTFIPYGLASIILQAKAAAIVTSFSTLLDSLIELRDVNDVNKGEIYDAMLLVFRSILQTADRLRKTPKIKFLPIKKLVLKEAYSYANYYTISTRNLMTELRLKNLLKELDIKLYETN